MEKRALEVFSVVQVRVQPLFRNVQQYCCRWIRRAKLTQSTRATRGLKHQERGGGHKRPQTTIDRQVAASLHLKEKARRDVEGVRVVVVVIKNKCKKKIMTRPPTICPSRCASLRSPTLYSVGASTSSTIFRKRLCQRTRLASRVARSRKGPRPFASSG